MSICKQIKFVMVAILLIVLREQTKFIRLLRFLTVYWLQYLLLFCCGLHMTACLT
jgi:hypothetical protein